MGIVRGLAAYYDEADRIDVMLTTSEDGKRVRIRIRWRWLNLSSAQPVPFLYQCRSAASWF